MDETLKLILAELKDLKSDIFDLKDTTEKIWQAVGKIELDRLPSIEATQEAFDIQQEKLEAHDYLLHALERKVERHDDDITALKFKTGT